jgi:hypothetical protein
LRKALPDPALDQEGLFILELIIRLTIFARLKYRSWEKGEIKKYMLKDVS